MAATGADVAADDDDDTLPLPHIPSVISLGSLPPQIDGPVSGYVRLTVHLHVENDDVEGHREWLVRVRWWGSMTTVGKGDLLRENQQLCFPVHVARDVFRRYLDDMTQLRFDVVDKVTHRVYGQSAIPIRLDDLEAVGGCQRDIEIVKRGGRNNIGGVLSLHAALLWGGDASSELPPHDGMTTAPQFQLQQPHASPRRVEGAVRVWKNKDFPQSSFLAQVPLLELNESTPSTTWNTSLGPHASDVTSLLHKGEALRRAMQRAMDEPHDRAIDIPTILASAKSFGPVDLDRTVTSWPVQTMNMSPVYTRELPTAGHRRLPNPPLVAPHANDTATPLEMLLRVDWLRDIRLQASSSDAQQHDPTRVYVTHKALVPPCTPFTSESKRIPHASLSTTIALGYQAVLPCGVLNQALIHLFDAHQLVVEVWTTTSARDAQLLGLGKLSLKVFAHAVKYDTVQLVQNKAAGVDRRTLHRSPCIGMTHDCINIKNPFTGAAVGSITCTRALGTRDQIRGFQTELAAVHSIQAWWRGRHVFRRHRSQLTPSPQATLPAPDSVTVATHDPSPTSFPDDDSNHKFELARPASTIDNSNVMQPSDEHENRKTVQQHVSAVIKIQRAYRRWRDMATMAHAFLDWTTDEENHMSTEDTPSFDIDLDTIQLLNDPAPPRLEQASPCKGHDVLPSPLADPHHQNTPTGDKLSWRLVLELAEPCPLHRGIEVTYLFQDTTSSLWWDSHSTALSSRNEHEYIDEGLDLLIEFALWGSGESTNPIGHATLNVSTLTKSKQEVVQLPITWTEPPLHPLLPHFSDKIASLPLRVQCAMHQKSSLAVYSPKTSNSVATSVVSSTTLLPATATICVQITSIDMLGAVSVVGWHVFFRCVVPVGVRVHPKATGSTEYDTAQGQFLSIQTSPTILLTCGKVHVEFEHHVVIHPELLEAMQEQAKDGGAVVHLYRHVMDMEILMGTVSIPLAALLYRRQGIRGAFAFDQRDEVHCGRLGVAVHFLHRRVESDPPGATSILRQPTIDPPLKSFSDQDPSRSIHDIDFLLDENVTHDDDVVAPMDTEDTNDARGHEQPLMIVVIEEARNLHHEVSARPHTYTSFQWGTTHYETPAVEASCNPTWMHEIRLEAADRPSSKVAMHVWDQRKSLLPPLWIGQATIDLTLLQWTHEICGWYHITDATDRSKGQLKVRFNMVRGPRPEADIAFDRPRVGAPFDHEGGDEALTNALQLMVNSVTAMDMSRTHHDRLNQAAASEAAVREISANGRSCTMSSCSTAEFDQTVSRDHQCSISTSDDVCLVPSLILEGTDGHDDTSMVSHHEDDPTRHFGQPSAWNDDELLDMNALEIHGSDQSDSGEAGQTPQRLTTQYSDDDISCGEGHDEPWTAIIEPAAATTTTAVDSHPNPSEPMQQQHDAAAPTSPNASEPKIESFPTAASRPPQGVVETFESHHSRGSFNAASVDDTVDDLDLNELNIHSPPPIARDELAVADIENTQRSQGSSKMDIHELEDSNGVLPTLP
ncbi:hypothetical protein AaE_002880, partial [Aphanomyces astaci]